MQSFSKRNIYIQCTINETMAVSSNSNKRKVAKSVVSKKSVVHSSSTNTLALLSMIFGILFFIPFASLVAVILGFIGLNQIKRTNEEGRGMAIAGIALGFFWILVTIIFLILFMIFAFTALTTIVAANGTLSGTVA